MLRYLARGQYLFSMVPGNMRGENADNGLGVCYMINDKGLLVEQWRTEGWYSFNVYLSKDGHFLVRIGPWNWGKKPSTDDLAVAFYKDGKLLKTYSTQDLIVRPSMLHVSATHYRWGSDAKEAFKLDEKNVFELNTIDQMQYKFNAENGEMISKTDLLAKTPEHTIKPLEHEEMQSEQDAPSNR